MPAPAKDICEFYQQQGLALNAFLLGLVAGVSEPAPEPRGMYHVQERYALNEPEMGWRQVA